MKDAKERLNAEDIETLLESQMTEVVGGGNDKIDPTDPPPSCTCGVAFAKAT